MAERSGTSADQSLPDGEPTSVTRRAPFANNPVVGVRGQQAQQRILDAGLQVFSDVGYHRCGVKRITELAGCSRASFYQYFSSKEDLFRHLAGHVARELRMSAEALGPITADQAGWDNLRAWLDRYSAIYDAYEPVFVTFHAAAAADEEVAGGSARVMTRNVAGISSKIVDSPRTDADLADAVRTLLDTVARSNRVSELIELAHPDTPLSRTRLNAAMADVFHRAFFAVDPAVNARQSPRPAGAALADERDRAVAFPAETDDRDLGAVGMQTRAVVLEAGHQVFVERGYYGTRVDDIARAAGVSHGVFYRYFDNKNHLFRLLAARASGRLATAFDAIDEIDLGAPTAREDLHGWLRRYSATHAEEAAIIRVWTDAIARDPRLGSASVEAISVGRSSLVTLLRQRGGYGDLEAEALVLLALLEAMVAGSVSTDRRERVARVIERSVVGLDATGRIRGLRRGRRRSLEATA